MKLVTLFNEKGGTGKTTLSMMVASCLRYMMSQQVLVLDFDYPSHQLWSTRQMELDLIREGKIANLHPPGAGDPFYKIVQLNRRSLYSKEELSARKIANAGQFTPDELKMLVDYIRRIKETKGGYLICDFPGHFSSQDASYAIAKAGLIDLLVYLVDSDRQSQTGAIMVHGVVSSPAFLAVTGRTRQEELVIWNRETRSERSGKRDWYEKGNSTFEDLGIPVSQYRMKELLAMRRDSDTRNFVRSTVMFPLTEVMRMCPVVIDITMEIKDRLDAVI